MAVAVDCGGEAGDASAGGEQTMNPRSEGVGVLFSGIQSTINSFCN